MSIRGDVVLHDHIVELNVNSRQRGNILEDLVRNLLGNLIGSPEWAYVDVPSGSEEAFLASFRDEDNAQTEEELSKEEEEELIFSIKDTHYHEWIKSRIPALDNKTPRMAKRSKRGKENLISLLKDIENHENRSAKAQKIKLYDIRWMWDELELDREAA